MSNPTKQRIDWTLAEERWVELHTLELSQIYKRSKYSSLSMLTWKSCGYAMAMALLQLRCVSLANGHKGENSVSSVASGHY